MLSWWDQNMRRNRQRFVQCRSIISAIGRGPVIMQANKIT
nr:MAG TPA: hypothetical protein [Caudoviricetes sp.]DAL70555.1 MAG TPA: hypothetical protein [Caudoviricetes sp.]DAM23567.1 MAG TPA: hypothetical protein [Caudoviricetes sp.]